MDAEQRLAATEPDDVVERPSVFIEDRRIAEETLVPRSTPTKIGDGQRHMGPPGNSGMRNLLETGLLFTIALRSQDSWAPVRLI